MGCWCARDTALPGLNETLSAVLKVFMLIKPDGLMANAGQMDAVVLSRNRSFAWGEFAWFVLGLFVLSTATIGMTSSLPFARSLFNTGKRAWLYIAKNMGLWCSSPHIDHSSAWGLHEDYGDASWRPWHAMTHIECIASTSTVVQASLWSRRFLMRFVKKGHVFHVKGTGALELRGGCTRSCIDGEIMKVSSVESRDVLCRCTSYQNSEPIAVFYVFCLQIQASNYGHHLG